MHILAAIALFSCFSLQGFSFYNQNQRVTLLGNILFATPIEFSLELPISYKGNFSTATVDMYGNNKQVYFQLYDLQKPQDLFVLISEEYAQPKDTSFDHLYTSHKKKSLLYKLTRKKCISTDPKEALETWNIDTIHNTDQSLALPDNTIIIYCNPDMVEKLESPCWKTTNNIVYLPTIIMKPAITKEDLQELNAKMSLVLPDVKLCHSKPNVAQVKCPNSNQIISMPTVRM